MTALSAPILTFLQDHPGQEFSPAQIADGLGLTEKSDRSEVSIVVSNRSAKFGPKSPWRFVTKPGYGRYIYQETEPVTQEPAGNSWVEVAADEYGVYVLRLNGQLFIATPIGA